jgi:sugar phosphate permease
VCVQVVIAYTIGVAAMLAAFYFTPSSMPIVQWITVFMIGFFLYGPQMLIGLCGAELVCVSSFFCPLCPRRKGLVPAGLYLRGV